MAAQHFTIEDNGLYKPWHGRVWLNPPYGKETFRWIARLAEHKRGVALIFARTGTAGFQKHIFAKAHCVFFMKGRITFLDVNGKPKLNKNGKPQSGNADSVLVAFSDEDAQAIMQSGLKGSMVYLGKERDDCAQGALL